MIVSPIPLFKHAYGKYALGAYNINNAEQVMGLLRGNVESKAPFILQISKGARSYTDKRLLEAMIRAADEIFPEAIFAVHLDHGDEATCMDCIKSGFYTSVMIDASHYDFGKNIEITKRVCDAAHEKGVAVEAELGKLGGVEEHVRGVDPHVIEGWFRELNAAVASGAKFEDIKSEETFRTLWAKVGNFVTDPDQVEEFVKSTGCDSLACAIGTSHGAYKFKHEPVLAFFIIEEVARRLPGFPLVMHGASSVPEDEVRRINFFGGKLKDARGVKESDISKAAKMGVCKVNIDTDGRLVWCRVHREHFALYPENFDLRAPGKVFMAEYARYIAGKNKVLGSAGQLDSVRAALKT
ncbi:MAG: class II fructose-bisphosphate aldolase [Verrucomicrobiae bacterium]|nr:class II fructose-bisphosphate aldolase [Verrucomicrobiae bacterium]